MGGVCTSVKSTMTHAAAPGAAEETPEQPSGGGGAPVSNAKTGEESQVAAGLRDVTAPPARTAPNTTVDAKEESRPSFVGANADLDNFTPGEGSGVYLVEEKALNGTLVTQYAKERPAATEGLVLLQVKPPPYKPIPPSRFTVQGGKRVLKQNITASTKNAAGRAKYCGLVMDFIRLADTYKGFLWVSRGLEEANQPLSVFVVERKHRVSAVSVLQRGGSALGQANGGNQQQHEGGVVAPAEEQTPGEGHDTGTAGETEGGKQEQSSAGGKDHAETEQHATSDPEGDSESLYVQYLEAESTLSYRLLDRCGILPLPLTKAKEIIPPWTKVESMEDLRKKVEGAGKTMSGKKQNGLRKTKVSGVTGFSAVLFTSTHTSSSEEEHMLPVQNCQVQCILLLSTSVRTANNRSRRVPGLAGGVSVKKRRSTSSNVVRVNPSPVDAVARKVFVAAGNLSRCP